MPSQKSYLSVKVHPNARRDEVKQTGPNSYEVWTTATPDKGRANVAVAKLLAKHLEVAQSALVLKRGATSRTKLFEFVR